MEKKIHNVVCNIKVFSLKVVFVFNEGYKELYFQRFIENLEKVAPQVSNKFK